MELSLSSTPAVDLWFGAPRTHHAGSALMQQAEGSTEDLITACWAVKEGAMYRTGPRVPQNVSGAYNPADYLSQHTRPSMTREAAEAADVEEYVPLVVERSRLLPVLTDEIQEATQADECLQLAVEGHRGNFQRGCLQ
ncbi:hypothetical protein NDU88_006728 [Pleurodeles waltl]|uniref:Uncharacterized protein n=1 Tax=Pleurodeles waltl TaxID=8319 RepID=A0AAV7MDV8_PLEWA|nr:hypothetical protein NDU88_006728 [Pleurodeles waltl]